MKNPFSNETVKSAAIVIGSAAAFIAISKGVSVIRKKFGANPKMQAIFGAQDKAEKRNAMEATDTCGRAAMHRRGEELPIPETCCEGETCEAAG